jgi:hypothetical protein
MRNRPRIAIKKSNNDFLGDCPKHNDNLTRGLSTSVSLTNTGVESFASLVPLPAYFQTRYRWTAQNDACGELTVTPS